MTRMWKCCDSLLQEERVLLVDFIRHLRRCLRNDSVTKGGISIFYTSLFIMMFRKMQILFIFGRSDRTKQPIDFEDWKQWFDRAEM